MAGTSPTSNRTAAHEDHRSRCLRQAHGSSAPLVRDESIVNRDEVFRAEYEANAFTIIMRFGKLGCLTNPAEARDLGMAISVENICGGDIIATAISHIAAATRPGALLMTPFFNDWTNVHQCGHQPRSVDGFGTAPSGPELGADAGRIGAPLFSVGG